MSTSPKTSPPSYFSFSPGLCLSILRRGLLTQEEMEKEIAYLSIKCARPTRSQGIEYRQELLREYFRKCHEEDPWVCEDLLGFLKAANTPALPTVTTAPPTIATATPSLPTPPIAIPVPPPPVIDDNIIKVYPEQLVDVVVDDVMAELGLKDLSGKGRRTVYFGPQEYRYGKTSHPAKPYVRGPIMEQVLTCIQRLEPDFSTTEWSCLVTLYPNGKAILPLHSDNESMIAPGSKIWTVSVGAERDITLQSQQGVLVEETRPLPHGSVHSMAVDIQSSWKHGILRADTDQPRISFGFRKMRPEVSCSSPPKTSPKAPPIRQPTKQPTRQLHPGGTHPKVLLLTDSMLSSTPTWTFNQLGVRCVKKTMYTLADLDNHEPEIAVSQFVIINAGVNDLSRYGETSSSLRRTSLNSLRRLIATYPNTQFIINSVLWVDETKHPWLNPEIDELNYHLQELASVNATYLDTHGLLIHSRHEEVPIIRDGRERHGIHISPDAQRFLGRCLVREVGRLLNG